MWSLMQSVCAAARSENAHSGPADISFVLVLIFLNSCLILEDKPGSKKKTCFVVYLQVS